MGELDIATVGALLDEGYARLGEDPFLVVDLRAVTFADLVGVTALLRLHQRARASDGAVAFVRVGRSVARVLVLTGLAETLDSYDCVGCARLAHHAERIAQR